MPEITMETKAKQVRNDDIRARLPHADPDDRVVMTRGLASMGIDIAMEAMVAVQTFDAFTEDNDPWMEHDFGSFELSTGDKCFWKIDDYNGYDGIRCVLTVMLASEY